MPHAIHPDSFIDDPAIPIPEKGGYRFTVWAPEKTMLTLHLLSRRHTDTGIAMQRNDRGYFTAFADGVAAGDRYYYLPENDKQYPDPCSQYQPEGVHGPSEVVDHGRYRWQDAAWKGLPLSSLIFYEVHVGTFTPEGSFEAVIPRLDDLADLGITAIELMPVAECPGERNWGYDGVFLYAVQHNYGGPEGLKRLVDACHRRGIAVILDVVYNHIGGEGNCLAAFGPYFSAAYRTPWGEALNLDGAWSDGVRNFLVNNVLCWARHYHLDGLRFDAIHEIYDRNAVSIWDDLRHAARQCEIRSGRPFHLIAESDSNDPRTLQPTVSGGRGFHAQWLDDFHHSLYVLLDQEGQQHYQDYGEVRQLAKAFTDGFVFSGEYCRFRKRRHGASSAGLSGEQFVVFNQNHDLPGNRPDGARLSLLLDADRLRLAATVVLLSTFLPLLFMGEEYGETAPFYFFSDYLSEQRATALREQRRQQFRDFHWDAEAPDPQQPATFLDGIVNWRLRREEGHRQLLDWHRQLIALRKSHPLLSNLSRQQLRADLLGATGLAVHRHSIDGRQQLLTVFNFSAADLNASIPYDIPGASSWTRLLGSPGGPGHILPHKPIVLAPWSVSVYELTASRD